MKNKNKSKYKILVQILSMFFGFGSWIAMTGLWVELPLLTQKLPESWSLGSYLTIMIQLANIGPLIYWFARTHQICSEVTAIHIQMFIGTISCIVLIFWWDTTIQIGGVERSIVLLIAAFGLSIVDCTSSVVFLPYMAHFKSHHMTPYLIGEGLSGFLPSLVVLAQGVSEDVAQVCLNSTNTSYNTNESITIDFINSITTISTQSFDYEESTQNNYLNSDILLNGRQPRFSANIFFCFLLLILLMSWFAFICMDLLGVCKIERIDSNPQVEYDSESLSIKMYENENLNNEIEIKKIPQDLKSFNYKNKKYIWLLSLMCWGCFTTFGAMPSIQSYSSLPYGTETFFYAVTLAGLAYPVACMIGFFIDIRSPILINTLTILGSSIGIYILVCGIMSPNPPFKKQTFGSIIMILSWIIYVALISYMKTMVSLELNDIGGNQAMFWCGFAQQFGAASGGALIFCIINFTNIFIEEKCD